MRITKSFLDELRKHCTTELLSLVRGIEVKDDGENTWDITSIINDEVNPSMQLRVAYAFEQLGGVLIYNGKSTQFVIVTKEIDESICNGIRLFWIHNEANGVMPIYDTKRIIVPSILPKYTCRPDDDGSFVVEKLVFGKYEPINGERYLIEQFAKDRMSQLNSEEENAPE